jgi:hypothetical protein
MTTGREELPAPAAEGHRNFNIVAAPTLVKTAKAVSEGFAFRP